MKAHSFGKAGRAALAVVGLALGVCASIRAMADEPPLPPPRPPEFAPPAKAAPAPEPPPQAPGEGAAACLAKLTADGAAAEAAPAPPAPIEGCGIDAPVRVSSVTGSGGDVVSLPDRPLLDCAFAVAFADYVRLVVAPLGQALLRARVVAIETGPGYECRTQDRIAGAKISAHGHGLAVDVVAISFADQRRVVVERQTDADEASYFRALRTAACGWFTTVLGPGADSFHANNMHIDAERHGSSDRYRICQ
jgi:hypothetical protein